MYRHIAVAVDNSADASHAEAGAVALARAAPGAEITGYHVYSGIFHGLRFQALETYLPEEYRTAETLEYQRRIHSVLIGRGLEVISSEYLKRLREACGSGQIPFREVLSDGKRSDLLCGATAEHDLMVMGAQGIGRIDGAGGLGSTTERVLRDASCDLLVTRAPFSARKILVGIDGSAESFAALGRAIDLGKVSGAELTLLAAVNPALHREVFRLLSGVLSREAGEVFRFREQEDLHNRIIDVSLSDLYRGHLQRGVLQAAEAGLPCRTVLGEGPAWHALCTGAGKGGHDLVVVGRFGMHRGPRDRIGSNAVRVAERAPGNVLVVGAAGGAGAGSLPPQATPAVDASPGAALHWDDEAKEKIGRIPSFARPMALLAIERYAREQGIDRITPAVMDAARRRSGL